MTRRLSILATVVTALGVLLIITNVVSAKHSGRTHNNPEAILPGLENADLPPKVVENISGGNEYVVTSDTEALHAATDAVVTNWNNGLRNYAPNNLTKYVFHKNPGYFDPTANVRVVGYYGSDFDLRCKPGGHAAYRTI